MLCSFSSTGECDHHLRLAYDRRVMHESEHKSKRVDFERWIVIYILPLCVDAPWFEGRGVINKVVLNFAAKFQWFLMHY